MTTLVYKYKNVGKRDGLWLDGYIESEGETFKIKLPDNGTVFIGNKEIVTTGCIAVFRFTDFTDGIYRVKAVISGKLYTPQDIYIKKGKITPLSLTYGGLSELEGRINRLEMLLEETKNNVSYLLERIGTQSVLKL